MSNLSDKQELFVQYYLQTGNAGESARKAGYSKTACYAQGSKMLKTEKIKGRIAELRKDLDKALIADTCEVLEYLTRVMRGTEKDAFDLPVSIQERTRAACELSKRLNLEESNIKRVVIVNDIPKPKN